VIPKLVRLLAFLIYKQGLVHDLTYTRLVLRKLLEEEQAMLWSERFASSDKSKALAEVDLGVDILLILSSTDLRSRKVGVEAGVFKEVLGLLRFTEIKEESKDKLDVLEVFGL
jgi:hypothetical protein